MGGEAGASAAIPEQHAVDQVLVPRLVAVDLSALEFRANPRPLVDIILGREMPNLALLKLPMPKRIGFVIHGVEADGEFPAEHRTVDIDRAAIRIMGHQRE